MYSQPSVAAVGSAVGFSICRFNQLRIENIWKKRNYLVADVNYEVKPMIIASILNT